MMRISIHITLTPLMNMKRIILGAACLLSAIGANASDFFSTDECSDLFTFGARIGVNTSNRTMSNSAVPGAYHHESWGTGFDLGVTLDLNIRDYLSIQPGFFFESRSGAYTVIGTEIEEGSLINISEIAQAGKRSSYNFTIPVVASFHFNITDDLRWNVDAGPYVAFVLGSRMKNKRFVVNGNADEPLFSQKAAAVDFGIKMGTGLEILRHYYAGVHYMAGCIDAWKTRKLGSYTKNYGGVTKGWVFTVGYIF